MLYEEDHFHPSNQNDVEHSSKLLDKLNNSNGNYVSYYIDVPHDEIFRDTNGRIKKRRKIELYGSGDTGSKIRNAVTGNYTKHTVGTNDEYEYWSVSDCRGINGNKEPLKLFYDSPEQYERHMRVQLPYNIKEQWLNRRLEKSVSK
jgi:hypothetical protein